MKNEFELINEISKRDYRVASLKGCEKKKKLASVKAAKSRRRKRRSHEAKAFEDLKFIDLRMLCHRE
jgi:hypothetical protein